MVTISEYRKMLNDYKSSDDQILKRLEYLRSFCRNVIKLELENEIRKKQKNTIHK